MDEGLRSFLLVGDTTQKPFRALLDSIDGVGAVENWYKILPDAAVLVSRLDVDTLHSELKQVMPKQRYILVELERGKKNGWLPRKAWDFMNSPETVS